MARRVRKKTTFALDLFPFLSILACTIGTLILLIIVMTVQSLSNQRSVTIVAKGETGQNQNKQPYYVECRGEGVIIHPQKTFVPIADLNRRNSPLESLLERLQRRRNQDYLIVVVRPDGIEVFKELRAIVEPLGIDLGYEPLDEGWKLNLENAIN